MQSRFVGRKLEQDFRSKEVKPSDVNQQCVVYHFPCDLCDADYVGYTTRHLSYAGVHVREHKHSVIGKHRLDIHNLRNKDVCDQFTILKKCCRHLHFLIYEMLFIKNKKTTLNAQSDSIKAKVFFLTVPAHRAWNFISLHFLLLIACTNTFTRIFHYIMNSPN